MPAKDYFFPGSWKLITRVPQPNRSPMNELGLAYSCVYQQVSLTGSMLIEL